MRLNNYISEASIRGEATVENLYKQAIDNDSDIVRLKILGQIIKFYKEKFFSDTVFGKYAPIGSVKFLKDTKSFRTRAKYWNDRNQFAFSKRIFNTRFYIFRENILHEMCHWAVEKIDSDREEKPHGELWKRWMEKCGLPPVALDYHTNDEYK